MKIPKKVMKWKEKQSRGAIMKPSTFEKIKSEYKSEEKGEKAAGSAYYQALMKKYGEAHCPAEPL